MSQTLARHLTLALLALASPLALSGNSTGVIAQAHYNGIVTTNRGVCIQMTPTLPGAGWACLYKSSTLYPETSAALLSARVSGATCYVAWTNTDSDGFFIIEVVQC